MFELVAALIYLNNLLRSRVSYVSLDPYWKDHRHSVAHECLEMTVEPLCLNCGEEPEGPLHSDAVLTISEMVEPRSAMYPQWVVPDSESFKTAFSECTEDDIVNQPIANLLGQAGFMHHRKLPLEVTGRDCPTPPFR